MKRMQRVFGDLDALLHADGRLDDERRAAFLAHLADEPHEAERVAMWARQNDVLRATFASIAVEPVPLWLRLGHVAAERTAPRDAQSRADRVVRPQLVDPRNAVPRRTEAAVSAPAPRRRRAVSVGISAAVLLAIGLIVIAGAHLILPQPLTGEQMRADAEPAGGPVERAVDAYRTYALDPFRPVEIPATQQAALDRWLQHRLGLPVRAPDLRDQGWTALGGRLVPGENGPAAYYLYEGGSGERLGVYIAHSLSTPVMALSIDPILGGGAALSWVSGQTAYAVTAGRSLDWMSRNAEALRAGVLKPNPAE